MCNPITFALLWLLVIGWFCTRSPSRLASIAVSTILSEGVAIRAKGNQEFIRCLRDNPDTWHHQYPTVIRVIRYTGFVAFAMFGFGVALLVLTSFTA